MLASRPSCTFIDWVVIIAVNAVLIALLLFTIQKVQVAAGHGPTRAGAEQSFQHGGSPQAREAPNEGR